jgi:hypothetical protein
MAWPALSQRTANLLTEEERRDGWILLFDGATTQGWQEITGKPFPSKLLDDRGWMPEGFGASGRFSGYPHGGYVSIVRSALRLEAPGAR